MLFFTHVLWISGRSSYYVARGEDTREALGAVRALLERYPGASDVVTAQAWEWPDEPAPACPLRTPDGPPHAFKLQSRAYVESCLMALGVLASEAPPLGARPEPSGSPSPPAGAKRLSSKAY
jgi:hypothetical protein